MMPLEARHRLFVYGTLAPGQSNHSLLKDLTGTWQEGTIRGTLYPNGLGPTVGFPVVDLVLEASKINGWLFVSEELPRHWQKLDAFEGPGYKRAITTVFLKNNSSINAFVYALDHSKIAK